MLAARGAHRPPACHLTPLNLRCLSLEGPKVKLFLSLTQLNNARLCLEGLRSDLVTPQPLQCLTLEGLVDDWSTLSRPSKLTNGLIRGVRLYFIFTPNPSNPYDHAFRWVQSDFESLCLKLCKLKGHKLWPNHLLFGLTTIYLLSKTCQECRTAPEGLALYKLLYPPICAGRPLAKKSSNTRSRSSCSMESPSTVYSMPISAYLDSPNLW